MNDKTRAQLASMLKQAMREQNLEYAQLVAMTGLNLKVIGDALGYGLIDAIDLIVLCRALKLSAFQLIERLDFEIYQANGKSTTESTIVTAAVNPWIYRSHPKTSHLVEITYQGCDLFAHYLADCQGYQLGGDNLVPQSEVNRYREISESHYNKVRDHVLPQACYEAIPSQQQPEVYPG